MIPRLSTYEAGLSLLAPTVGRAVTQTALPTRPSCNEDPRPVRAGGLFTPLSEALCLGHSHGWANNEASQDLRPVSYLESVLLPAVAQPPLHGVVEHRIRASHPGKAPMIPRGLSS
jgi:hypothetical protein